MDSLEMSQVLVEDEFPEYDLSDPFFFDHPLDHLPGMYLVSETLEIACNRTKNHLQDLSHCEFSWAEFAELHHKTTCRATVSEDTFEGSLFQSRRLSSFRINWRNKPEDPLTGGEHPPELVKPEPIFAHKNFPENVFVSSCDWNANEKLQCFLIPPADSHQLAWNSTHVPPLFLLESCKQLLTVAAQTFLSGFANAGPRSKYQMILKCFSLELKKPISTSAKIRLEVDTWNLKKWRRNVPKAADFVVSIYVGCRVAGILRLESLIVEPDFFKYLRSK